jgi:dihydroorotase
MNTATMLSQVLAAHDSQRPLCLAGARLIDPACGLDALGHVWLRDGRIERIDAIKNIAAKADLKGDTASFLPDVGAETADGTTVVDVRGLVLAPALTDLCVRLREPGHEHEGLLSSELQAAMAGGVGTLVCLPDTDPVLDEPALIDMLRWRASRSGATRVLPLGALTAGLRGAELSEMAQLAEAGCIGFTQADHPLPPTPVLLRALQYAATFGLGVWLRPLEAGLGGGVAASGALATRLGLSGIPVAAETIAMHTVLELLRGMSAPPSVHFMRMSSAAGVALLRQAQAQGLPVTADVSINSLHLTDVDMGYFDTRARLVPPLRQQADRQALREALADGTLSALVSDHTPVTADEKTLPFAEATPGATGLELLLSLAWKWAADDGVPMARALAAVSQGPQQVLAASAGKPDAGPAGLQVGASADVMLWDPQAHWVAEPAVLQSQSHLTPFAGYELPGQVQALWLRGKLCGPRQRP